MIPDYAHYYLTEEEIKRLVEMECLKGTHSCSWYSDLVLEKYRLLDKALKLKNEDEKRDEEFDVAFDLEYEADQMEEAIIHFGEKEEIYL